MKFVLTLLCASMWSHFEAAGESPIERPDAQVKSSNTDESSKSTETQSPNKADSGKVDVPSSAQQSDPKDKARKVPTGEARPSSFLGGLLGGSVDTDRLAKQKYDELMVLRAEVVKARAETDPEKWTILETEWKKRLKEIRTAAKGAKGDSALRDVSKMGLYLEEMIHTARAHVDEYTPPEENLFINAKKRFDKNEEKARAKLKPKKAVDVKVKAPQEKPMQPSKDDK